MKINIEIRGVKTVQAFAESRDDKGNVRPATTRVSFAGEMPIGNGWVPVTVQSYCDPVHVPDYPRGTQIPVEVVKGQVFLGRGESTITVETFPAHSGK